MTLFRLQIDSTQWRRNLQSTNGMYVRSRRILRARAYREDSERIIRYKQRYLFYSHSSSTQEQTSGVEDETQFYSNYCYGQHAPETGMRL